MRGHSRRGSSGSRRKIFTDVAKREFLPANEAYRDETRQALDRTVLCELLGLPSVDP